MKNANGLPDVNAFLKVTPMTKSQVILIFGLPGSGKTTLANKLAQKLEAEHFNADEIRTKFNDWDFSDIGRARQVNRMKSLASKSDCQFVILDFVCPSERYREMVHADLVIFMDTIAKGRFEDTNQIFMRPAADEKIDFHFIEMDSDNQAKIIADKLISFDWRKPTVQMLGRWQPFHDGHVALFERAIAKTGQVVIQTRDCHNWNASNPFDFKTVKDGIVAKLSSRGFIHRREYMIQLVPNIVNITYGRNVGYKIEEETFDENIHQISATKIRRSLGYES